MRFRVPTRWWRLTEEEADRCNPPIQKVIYQNGIVYKEIFDDSLWVDLGHIPTPRNEIEWFLHNLYHGFAMRYPWYKVFWFSVCNFGRFRTLEWVFEDQQLRETLLIMKADDGEFFYLGRIKKHED